MSVPVPGRTAAVGSIEGRSLKLLVWRKFRRDRIALTSLIVILFVLCCAIGAPLICQLVGVNPHTFYPDTVDASRGGLPKAPFGGISAEHPFGVEPPYGRDILARVLYGARTSMAVTLSATVAATLIGTAAGLIAAYYGGWVDSILSRLMDTLLAFPQLLFFIAVTPIVQAQLLQLGLPDSNGTRMAVIASVIATFGWPHIGRIVRGQALSVAKLEFIDSARTSGASSFRILFSEILPNVTAPIIVYATMIIPTYIGIEASLSFLGVGVKIPGSSWGQMLGSAIKYYASDPMYMMIPGLCLFVVVLAFNLLGDGLRDALDPRKDV